MDDSLQNLHTHSVYCDGKDTLEELVAEAIEKGFGSLGFSGHSYMHFSPSALMAPEKEAAYKQEIAVLKEKYKERIALYCGLELELYSKVDISGYDYIIGSAHYFKIDGEYVGFDRSAEVVKGIIDNYFCGNGMKYVRAYYETLSQLTDCERVDIVGHFDLVTKHSETHRFFDIESNEYKKYALEALDVLASRCRLFEVNTGAIARGFRTTPYPAAFILKELKKRNCGILLSSDCHNKTHLDCYFREAESLVRECGFKEKYILTKNGFEAISLERE